MTLQVPFDFVVNSAGLAQHGHTFETTAADFDAAIDLNLRMVHSIGHCNILANL